MLKVCVFLSISFLYFWGFGWFMVYCLDPKGRRFGFGCVWDGTWGRMFYGHFGPFWPSNCSTQIHDAIVEGDDDFGGPAN